MSFLNFLVHARSSFSLLVALLKVLQGQTKIAVKTTAIHNRHRQVQVEEL